MGGVPAAHQSENPRNPCTIYIVHTQQQDANNHNNLALLDLGVFKHSHCLCLCLGGFCPR